MNFILIAMGGVLIAIAGALFVMLQLPKNSGKMTVSLLSLAILLFAVAGLMTLVFGTYPG